MTCKDCIHERVCEKLCPRGLLPYQSSEYPAELFCLEFKNKADVVEVKHGEWELKSEIHTLSDDVDEEFYVECPFCHRTEWIPFEFEEEKMLEYARKHFPYCHCGAKMDGERRCE